MNWLLVVVLVAGGAIGNVEATAIVTEKYETRAECEAAQKRTVAKWPKFDVRVLEQMDHPHFNAKTGEPPWAISDGMFYLRGARHEKTSMGLNFDMRVEVPFQPAADNKTYTRENYRRWFADLWRISEKEADQIGMRVVKAKDQENELSQIAREMRMRWLAQIKGPFLGEAKCAQI